VTCGVCTVEDTLPKLLCRNRQQWGTSLVAMRKKEYGIWREYTWNDSYEMVKAIFLGLTRLGIGAGDSVSILADNNPEWFWSELAVQTARSIVIGLNSAGSIEETKGLMILSRAKFAMVQDQEQVDKLLAIKKELPSLQRIIYWNGKGLRHYDNPILISLDELIRMGEEHEKNQPGDFERRLAHGKGDDIAVMLFTLGANDSPKLVPATHKFLLSAAEAALTSNPVHNSDEYVSIISPAWFFEQTLGFCTSLLTGQRLNFAERTETAPQDMREISPDVLAYPPKLWKVMAETIQENMVDGTWLKKRLYSFSLSLGYKRIRLTQENHRMGLVGRSLGSIADLLVLRPLRDKHGFIRARVIYTAGGTPPEEIVRFFSAIGVNVQQIFGSTKGGIVTEPPAADLKIE
jgi:long-chain acyl-CoA synthetase